MSEKRYITINVLCAAMAYGVCRQSPYNSVDGVDTINRVLRARVGDWDSPDVLPMRWFESPVELRKWMEVALKDVPQLQQWNTKVNGQDGHVFVSRYGGPEADADFIDIDALLGNVAHLAWNESSE